MYHTSKTPNVVIITLDSCRWETVRDARPGFLEKHCPPKRAYAQATFTYAAHLAILQGILPAVREHIPYYNRHTKQLIRIHNRPIGPGSLFNFPAGTEDITAGFKEQGYKTLATGAMAWFRHPHLQRHFDHFLHTGIHAERQVEFFKQHVSSDQAFFALINFGETHSPYEINVNAGISDMHPSQSRIDRTKLTEDERESEIRTLSLRQVRCYEYLNEKIAELHSHASVFDRNTVWVVVGDHGECFGEDSLHGHGFYHPKVMEVPMAIFDKHSCINGNLQD